MDDFVKKRTQNAFFTWSDSRALCLRSLLVCVAPENSPAPLLPVTLIFYIFSCCCFPNRLEVASHLVRQVLQSAAPAVRVHIGAYCHLNNRSELRIFQHDQRYLEVLNSLQSQMEFSFCNYCLWLGYFQPLKIRGSVLCCTNWKVKMTLEFVIPNQQWEALFE